jgi:hypothetical protein
MGYWENTLVATILGMAAAFLAEAWVRLTVPGTGRRR